MSRVISCWPSMSACKDNNHRHVVGSPSSIGRHHQFPRRLIGIRLPAQNLADFLILDMRRKAVAAQHQTIAALQAKRDRLGAGGSVRARPQRSRDHVLMLVMARLLGCNLPDLDKPLDQRMVASELAQTRPVVKITTAIPHPGYGRLRR